MPLEFGLYTFVENTVDPLGERRSPAERLRDLLEEAELAEAVGLQVFGVGEHHREEYLASAPAVVLAAIASRTQRIRLTSAVTVLSSEDPIRVFQQFATLDLLSGGRAEIGVGRGSFLESFPLFGYDLRDYEALFEEKLALLLRLCAEERPHWPGGRFTKPLDGSLGVYPRPVQNPLPVWVAVGGTPESVLRAAALGLPMVLGIIGGRPERFLPLVELYREVGQALPLGIAAHGFVAETREEALRLAYAAHAPVMNRIGRERGWPPLTEERFRLEAGPRGAYFVGTPEEVAEKILRWHALFRFDRLLLQLSVGSLPHGKLLKAIELLGTRVLPLVEKEVGAQASG